MFLPSSILLAHALLSLPLSSWAIAPYFLASIQPWISSTLRHPLNRPHPLSVYILPSFQINHPPSHPHKSVDDLISSLFPCLPFSYLIILSIFLFSHKAHPPHPALSFSPASPFSRPNFHQTDSHIIPFQVPPILHYLLHYRFLFPAASFFSSHCLLLSPAHVFLFPTTLLAARILLLSQLCFIPRTCANCLHSGLQYLLTHHLPPSRDTVPSIQFLHSSLNSTIYSPLHPSPLYPQSSLSLSSRRTLAPPQVISFPSGPTFMPTYQVVLLSSIPTARSLSVSLVIAPNHLYTALEL